MKSERCRAVFRINGAASASPGGKRADRVRDRAIENSFLNNERRGIGSRINSTQLIALGVAGDNTVTGSCPLPAGAWLKGVMIETPAAISGSPTSSNVQVGSTSGGSDIVAAVNAAAQGHIAPATILSTFDKVNRLANASAVYAQVTTSGGTSSAGTINVLVEYSAPVA